MGDDLGSNPNFIEKFGSDSATDEESDQASNKKLVNITKLVPCSKIQENDVNTQKFTRNKLTLKEKLEIIKLRDNGVSSVKIARDRNIAESSVRTIYLKKVKLQFQGTLANPSQNRTRSMDIMESLLSLWIQNLDQRKILVGTKQIQAKAKSLYLHVKENLENKTEAEMKETFVASNGWLQQYKKRHHINIAKITGKAKSGDHWNAGTLNNKRYQCPSCDYKPSRRESLKCHIKGVHKSDDFSQIVKIWVSDETHLIELSKSSVKNLLKPTYTCNECETPFETKQQMEWHINSVHLNEKPYKCNLCDESFFIDSQLKQHLKRTHRICGEKISLFE